MGDKAHVCYAYAWRNQNDHVNAPIVGFARRNRRCSSRVGPRGKFYYRGHAPRILIEYNRRNADHDHVVIRDPSNDYGEDWLGGLYEVHHPSTEEAIETARRRAGFPEAS